MLFIKYIIAPWPSGKAVDSDSMIVGSNPSGAANMLLNSFWSFFGGKIMIVYHTLEPFYNKKSKILILGTMPSSKSREYGFYYMHPQNRFWKVLSEILGENFPTTIQDKKVLLNKYGIALWDVLSSCDIIGSSDSSIKNPKPNDIKRLIYKTNINAVFVNSSDFSKDYCSGYSSMLEISTSRGLLPPGAGPTTPISSRSSIIEAARP